MRKGFSLVELSIVLVILGLLVGGILAGQSLIRASELRSVTSQLQGYHAALYSFRDKYFGLPGDMRNATSFWGDDNANCPDASPNGTPGTCNGDANGLISWVEGLRAWQQMANAGLIEGTYSGVVGTTANFIGTSVPAGKMNRTGFQFWSETKSAQGWTGGDSATTVQFIRIAPIYAGADPPVRLSGEAFKPEEAWNIDTKLDDGKPGMGRFFVYTNTGGCNDSATVTTAVYALNVATLSCMPQFIF